MRLMYVKSDPERPELNSREDEVPEKNFGLQGENLITMDKLDDEGNTSSSDNQASQDANSPSALYHSGNTVVIPAGAIQISAHGDGSGQGLQTLTMSNSNGAGAAGTIVQYGSSPDTQYFIPASGVQTFQLSPATSLAQGVVMTSSATLSSSGHVTEEVSRKRELRLLKNREAAKECRRKKKEYVKCLENRVAVLENQNKALIEELKSLKELYCQKEVV